MRIFDLRLNIEKHLHFFYIQMNDNLIFQF